MANTRSDEHSTMAAHTKGPWSISAGRTLEHIIGSDGHGICSVGTTPISKDATPQERIAYCARAMADARLIAAAPDLLEAAKVVLAGLNARIDSAPANAVPLFTGISALHDAIAKAGG